MDPYHMHHDHDTDAHHSRELRDRVDVENDARVVQMTKELERSQKKVEQYQKTIEVTSKRKEKLVSTRDRLKKELSTKGIKDSNSDVNDETKKIDETKKEENEQKLQDLIENEVKLFDKIELLQKRIQRESRRSVIDLFGEGPHYVKIDLKPQDLDEIGQEESDLTIPEDSYIVLEMAPVSLMPYSVNVFLHMMALELHVGSAFHVNLPHIVQVNPIDIHTFVRAELGPLGFQEYSHGFPHERYTVGFADRPAGPSFYVNKIDNTDSHGPGGQNHHLLHEEGEPCFAKVVEGHHLIDEIGSWPVKGSFPELKRPVKITGTHILEQGTYVPPTKSE